MNGLLHTTHYGLALGILFAIFLFRQFALILAAEQGRKHDLVKRLYKNNQAFHLAILIPFLDSNQHSALLSLLLAIQQQHYPVEKVAIHLVVSTESEQELIPQSLQSNVRVWRYPGESPRTEHALAWLIERCLAIGGEGLFVFLQPTDLIKPDFFQNVAARGIDSFAFQGYVALKNTPETLIDQVFCLSARLFNRIGNAGRRHLGMSCRLLNSGWAIKQEVLEMIPYRRGLSIDNLEYTLRLNLEDFQVDWAPNMVTYSDSHVPALQQFTTLAGTFLDRIHLLLYYGPPLLTRLLVHFDLNQMEQVFGLLTPPYFLTCLTVMAIAVFKMLGHLNVLPGSSLMWTFSAIALLGLNMMALVVARCKLNDYFVMLFYTPLTYLLGVVATPVAFYQTLLTILMSKSANSKAAYRKARNTRFNESLPSAPNLLDPDLEHSSNGQQVIRTLLKNNTISPRVDAVHSPNGTLQRESIQQVPLSNGKKQVDCSLKTVTNLNEVGPETYRLTLEYKDMSFSTSSYRILDQAFYELHAKLSERGLTLITCGSCGNFYNPTADVPDILRSSGVCLANKLGQEVSLNTDSVTVTSQACPYHCPLEQRENIVRQWKESLALLHSPVS